MVFICKKCGRRWSDRTHNHCTYCGAGKDFIPEPQRPLDKLDETALALLKNAPANETLRGLVLAQTNIWLPADCNTTEAITALLSKMPEPVKEPKKPEPEPANKSVTIKGRYTERESGRCDYTCNNNGIFEFEVSGADMQEWAEQCSTVGQLSDLLADKLWEQAEADKNYRDADGYDYNDHEPSDDEPTDNFSPDFGTPKNALLQRLIKELLPEAELKRLEAGRTEDDIF